MSITGKIVFGFLAGATLFFLVVATFFQPSKSVVEEFTIPEQESFITATGGIYADNISLLDTLYTSVEQDSFQREGGVITLNQGEFFLDTRDVQVAHSFENSYFKITPVGIGTVYIDTTDPKQYTIMSLGSILALELRDGTSKDKITEVYIYPHMSLSFNPTRNKFMKQADLIRISSVFDLEYYTSSFFLSSETQESSISPFFDKVSEALKKQNIQNTQLVSKIDTFDVWSFPTLKYIQQYSNIFVNDEKKKVYYKNRALDSILELVHTNKKDTKLVEEAYEDIQKLDSYPEDSEEILQIFDAIYSTISYSYDKKHIYPKLNLAQLQGKLTTQKINKSLDYLSAYILDSLYRQYDYTGKYSYDTLNSFFETYLKELGIDVYSTEEELENKNTVYLEYFSFFVENIILSRFTTSLKSSGGDLLVGDNLETILGVMKGYIALNNAIYPRNISGKTISLTYRYINVLQSVQLFIRESFFQSDRSNDGLLVKSTQNSMSQKVLGLFESNVNQILGFYEDGKKFLDPSKQRDIFIQKEYDQMLQVFPEYFAALGNYESYVFNYNVEKKNLLDVKTFGDDQEVTLSREDFLRYISQFKFLSLDSLQLEVIDETYYQVGGIFIEGKQFGFYLYPFSDNKIDTITINGTPINSSYKLDNIEFLWEEKIKGLSGDEKDTYDFSLFFSNTFLNEEIASSDIFEVNTDIVQEDSVIVVFKRDKLLGKNGEFAPVGDILNIQYKNLDVVKGSSGYDISIKDAIISLSALSSSRVMVDTKAYFRSDYLLTATKHQFRNISLKLFNEKNGLEILPLGENNIDFVGSINLQDFKAELQKFAASYEGLVYIYNILKRELEVEDFSLKYALFNSKITIKFDYNNEKITIEMIGDSIEEITTGNTSILPDSIPYREFGNFISQIKK